MTTKLQALRLRRRTCPAGCNDRGDRRNLQLVDSYLANFRFLVIQIVNPTANPTSNPTVEAPTDATDSGSA